MIDKIYEEIRTVLLGLKLNEAKEYFDFDNIPDSLADNSFIISPVIFEDNGNSIQTSDTTVVIGLTAGFKINLSMKLPVNNIVNELKTTLVVVENILKGILSIVVGEDEKDGITFAGSSFIVDNNKLIYEINFNIDYRINNL